MIMVKTNDEILKMKKAGEILAGLHKEIKRIIS